MRFDTPFMLFAAPAVGLIVFLAALWARSTRLRHARRWSAELGRLAHRNGRLGPAILALVGVVAVLALAGPRWGSRSVIAENKALNLVIAMDVSRSMLARDVTPSRLGRARDAAARLIYDLESDRIGLIAFAGESYVLSPLTMDAGALLLLLNATDPEISSANGTDLALALRQGREVLLSDTDLADRVLVVFTDGETHGTRESALEEAARIRREGIRLILVAEGTTEPTRIPVVSPEGEVTGYYRDQQLEFIETMRRDDLLASVADQAQGAMVAAELTDQAGSVRDLIANFKRAPQATTTASQGIVRAWIPMLVAVALLLAHTFTRKTAALAGLVLLVGLPGRSLAQHPSNPADDAWPGDPGRAARFYEAQVRAGDGGDTTVFNAGSAALAAGDTALARRALSRAARSVDPGIRFRALFNLGLFHHYLARVDPVREEVHLADAVAVYRQALLLDPADTAAKWNLELAIRSLPPSGSDNSDESDGPQQQGAEDDPAPASGLSQSQAEQILNSILEEERQTRERMNQRRNLGREILRDREW